MRRTIVILIIIATPKLHVGKETCRFPRRAVDMLFSYDTKCEGTEFRRGSLYLHHAVKEVLLEKTCASVKKSELPLQAAAEKLTFDFEKSCANPKTHVKGIAGATVLFCSRREKCNSVCLCASQSSTECWN